MDRRSTSLLLMLAAIWGASYLLIKIGGRDLSAPMIAFLRTLLGAGVVIPLALRAGAMRDLSGLWPVITVVAIAQVAAPFLLIALGEEEISSSLAGILVASAPIFTALLAIFFDAEERSEGSRMLGVLAGLAGLVLLLGLDLGGSTAELLGGLAVVLAGLGYAIAGLLAKRRLASIPAIGVAALVLGVSTVVSLPAAMLTLPSEAPGIGPLAAIAALGVLGTGIAFVMFYELIATVGPARTYLVTYLAGVRGRLRRAAARRGLWARHAGRITADSRRVVPGGGRRAAGSTAGGLRKAVACRRRP